VKTNPLPGTDGTLALSPVGLIAGCAASLTFLSPDEISTTETNQGEIL